jgi:hypothetical protein
MPLIEEYESTPEYDRIYDNLRVTYYPPIDPHIKGTKLDTGKNRLALVLEGFSRALEAIGEVGAFGAQKYINNGWVEVPNGVQRYKDALYMHLLKNAQGEMVDLESGLPHLWHALWNLSAVVELTERAKVKGTEAEKSQNSSNPAFEESPDNCPPY